MQCSSMNPKKQVEQIKYPPYNSFPSVYQVKGSKYQRITHLSNSGSMHPSTVTIYCCNHRQTLRRLTASRSPGGPIYYLSLSPSLSLSLSLCSLDPCAYSTEQKGEVSKQRDRRETREKTEQERTGIPQWKENHNEKTSTQSNACIGVYNSVTYLS